MKIHLQMLIVLTLFFQGCAASGTTLPSPTRPYNFAFRGLLYSHTVHPLDVNHNQTKIIQTSRKGSVKHFQYYVTVVWGSNAIGDIAKREGLETIHYADVEVVSFLLGIFNWYTVHVYGE